MSNALYVAWRGGSPESGTWSPVGKLEHVDGLYRFTYTQGARTLDAFSPFPGMTHLDRVYESEELFPLFANRLLSKSRPEYEAYLTWGGFDPNDPPDPLAILGVTEGIRQTDQLEVFPCPTPDADGCYLTKFFLHGLRWMPGPALERIAKLTQGERLAMMLDLQNPYDQHAVALRTIQGERFLLGYVPRYLAQDLGRLSVTCNFAEVTVQRVNSSAPLQMRVLCRMNACWPDDFKPCDQDAYQPIVEPVARQHGVMNRA
jgi:hypothetical protein